MEETPAGSCGNNDGVGEGERTAAVATAVAAWRADWSINEGATNAAGRGDTVVDAGQGDATPADPYGAEVAAPTAGIGAAASKAVEPQEASQATGAASEEALYVIENVGTAAARAAAEAAANLDFDPFAEADLAAKEQEVDSEVDVELLMPEDSGMERIPGRAAVAAEDMAVGAAEASSAERETAAGAARAAAAIARGAAATDEGALDARETEAATVATPEDGRGGGGGAAAAGGRERDAVPQPAAAEAPLVATEAAASAEAQAAPGAASRAETDLTGKTSPLGGEAVAGKQATAVKEEEAAIREEMTLEAAGRAGTAAISAATEETSANMGGGGSVEEEEAVLRQFRGDVAGTAVEPAFATAGDSADSREGVTVTAKPERVAPPLAGEDAEALRGYPAAAAAEVATGPENGGSTVLEGGRDPGELQRAVAARAVTSKLTCASAEEAMCHSTEPPYATTTSEAATAVAPLGSSVDSGVGVYARGVATVLNGDGSAEAMFDGGDRVSAFSPHAGSAAPSVRLEAETAVEREGGAPGGWIAESIALKGEETPSKAATSTYEVHALGGFAEGAESGGPTSFVGVPQQVAGIGSRGYRGSSSGDEFNGSYNSNAGGSGSAASCSEGETRNSPNLNSNYDNRDSEGAGSSSSIDLTGSLGSSSGAEGSGSSTGLLDNIAKSDYCSSADGGSSCEPGPQYYGEGGTQQLCLSQNFRGSTGDEDVYNRNGNEGLGYGNGSSGGSSTVAGSSLVCGSSTAGLETLMIEEMAAEASGSSSTGLPTEGVTDCNTLAYPDPSSSNADYYGSMTLDESAAAATEVYGETADLCNGIGVAGWRAEREEEEGQQLRDDEDLDDSTETKQPWRGVLGTDDLLTERDNDILQLLADDEPPIPDELCRYFLHRVGCAATDLTVARLVSVAAQLQLERVMDDAKVFAFCMQHAASTGASEEPVQVHHGSDLAERAFEDEELFVDGRTPDDVDELDLGSLCAALQKNGDNFSGLNLDCFLDPAPVFLPALTGTSGAAELRETAATIPVMSPAAYPATVEEPMVDGNETESRTMPHMAAALGSADYAAGGGLLYRGTFQSSLNDMQSMSASILSESCDAVRSNSRLLVEASRSEALYAASAEEYDSRSAASSLSPASFTAVSREAAACQTADGTGEVPSVLSDNNPFPASAAPVTDDDTYPPMDAVLRDAPFGISRAGAADAALPVGMEVPAGLPTATAGLITGAALDSDVDMEADAAAGLNPACIGNGIPVAGVTGSLNGLVSAPSESSAAGVVLDSTLSTGVLHALSGVGSMPSPVLEGSMSLAAEGTQVADASVNAGAGDSRAALVDISVGAVGAPAGDFAAGGVSVGDAANGSVFPAAGPPFLSALDVPAQAPPAIGGASVLPPIAAEGIAATCPGAAAEFNATPLEASVEDVEVASAGTPLLSTPLASASCDAPPPDSVSMRSAATYGSEVPAVFTSTDTTARFAVECAVPTAPFGTFGNSRAESPESPVSTAKSTQSTLQMTATAVCEAAATTRDTAADNEVSDRNQLTGSATGTDAQKKL